MYNWKRSKTVSVRRKDYMKRVMNEENDWDHDV